MVEVAVRRSNRAGAVLFRRFKSYNTCKRQGPRRAGESLINTNSAIGVICLVIAVVYDLIAYQTAGESHGRALVAIVEGIPSGVPLTAEVISQELARRQLGYGRGGRMKIERDEGKILSGVRHGLTIGSPIAILVENADWKNWQATMSPESPDSAVEPVTQPRPGHADLPGALKTGQEDIRNVLERASARETAARVAAGSVAKAFLAEFGIDIVSHVVGIGEVKSDGRRPGPRELPEVDRSPVRCFDDRASSEMVKAIDKAERLGDTLGGIFELIAYNCPPGLGGYATWADRLDGRIAAAVMGIQAIKGVEIGDGFALSERLGSVAHDEIMYSPEKGYYRKTNRAGGIEGGVTNGEPVVVRAVMKPIPTLRRPLRTVDIRTKEARTALKERSDVCAVPAAAVVGEAALALELAKALVEKFGGDCLADIKGAVERYKERISE